MTIALYHSGGPLACIGSGRMWDDLAAKAEPDSELGRFCVDGAGLADAGLADAAAATGTKCGLLLARVLRSPQLMLPAMVWIDDWKAEPERAVVNVEPKFTVVLPDLKALAEAIAAAARTSAEANARMVEALGKIKFENHLPPMNPTFKGGDVHLPPMKPTFVGGKVVVEGIEV